MFEIKNKNDPKAYVYHSETATNLLDAVAEAHTLGYTLDGADLSGLKGEGRACPHGVSRLAPCDECTAAQAHTTSASAPACAHDVPYPDPCLSCANEHLHAAADAPPTAGSFNPNWKVTHPTGPATAEATQVGSTTALLEERGSRYGKFADHARITQILKCAMQNHVGGNWPNLEMDQKEALEMIAHKIGRIINGDPNYEDSWRDVAGYAQLVADRLKGITR